MPLAVLLLGIVIQSLGVASVRQQDVERRTETVQQAQIGLERMTREIRSATWVYFSSSSVVDMDALVRPTPTSTSVHRHVRYDCSGATCVRYEGVPVSFPPIAGTSFESSKTVIGAEPGDRLSRYGTLAGHDVFFPQRVTTSGQAVNDFVDPDMLLIRVRLAVPRRNQTIELRDGVSLRNRSDFA